MAVHVASSGKSSRRPKPEHGNSLRKAFHEIRELIVHGRLSPGSWIVEADLARHLAMSRTPVRSALHLLQREGYVIEHTNVRKSRMVVAPLTQEDATELYQVIGHVEGLAGRRTATLPKSRRNEIAARLKQFNEQLREIAESGDSRASGIFEIDRSFHRAIIEAGAGPRLTALHKSIEPQAERYWRLYASWIMHDLHPSLEEHDEIISAISNGDADRTERALQVNWENGCARLAKVIEIFGERGSW
ncbi:MAG TPA: GntR family transcriptional regulator [Acidobacteriaceae bacterium]|nr:GntR family transcriptional regulator [Acidobacteriaceae bacterium]